MIIQFYSQQITDVPTVDFIDTLKHTDNKYNNNYPPLAYHSNYHLLLISCKSFDGPVDPPEMC